MCIIGCNLRLTTNTRAKGLAKVAVSKFAQEGIKIIANLLCFFPSWIHWNQLLAPSALLCPSTGGILPKSVLSGNNRILVLSMTSKIQLHKSFQTVILKTISELYQ